MVNREHLKRGALRAYELGRLKAAMRAAWLLAPAAALCAIETGARETCACIGTLLVGAAVFLRWRNRQGVNVVRHGLLAGALPLIAGLIALRVAPGCAAAPLVSACTALCFGVGVPSGTWLGLRLVRSAATVSTWLTAISMAILASSLGCIGLGVAGVSAAGSGLVLGVSLVIASIAFAGRPKES
jgi:hypothetical protein